MLFLDARKLLVFLTIHLRTLYSCRVTVFWGKDCLIGRCHSISERDCRRKMLIKYQFNRNAWISIFREKKVNCIRYILLLIIMILSCIYFLLSEHIVRKESIVIVKKFDFEILTYFCILRSAELFLCYFCGDVRMHVCMCVCMCVCMIVNMIASKRYIRLSLNSVCILQVTIERTL